MPLKHFNLHETVITKEEAVQIIRFFWPDVSVAPQAITDKDRAFAQALLLEALDASYNMGFTEELFKAFYMKVPGSFESIKSMVKKFAQQALKHWFKHATAHDLKDPKIYESVRVTLARNFRSVWRIKEQTGDLLY